MDQEKKTLLLAGEDMDYERKMADFFHQYRSDTCIIGKLQEAQELFFKENHRIDIVLLEGGTDQSSMGDIIRGIRSYSDIPIIIQGEDINEDIHFVYMEMGADYCMDKTSNMKMVSAYVDNLYRRRHLYRKKSRFMENYGLTEGLKKFTLITKI